MRLWKAQPTHRDIVGLIELVDQRPYYLSPRILGQHCLKNLESGVETVACESSTLKI